MHEAILITEVTSAWMQTHFRQQLGAGEDMQTYLIRRWGVRQMGENTQSGKSPEQFCWESDMDAATADAYALRFNGGKHDEGLREGKAAGADETLPDLFESHYARTLELYPNFLHSCGIFFWLQKSIEWNGSLTRRFQEGNRHPQRWRDWTVKGYAARARGLASRLSADVEAKVTYWESGEVA